MKLNSRFVEIKKLILKFQHEIFTNSLKNCKLLVDTIINFTSNAGILGWCLI